MSARTKQQPDNYPVRYSLLPDERKGLLSTFARTGGATPEQIKKYSHHHKVATKAIHNALVSNGLAVLPSQDPEPSRQKSHAHLAAESFFKIVEPQPDPEPVDIPEAIQPEAEDLATLAEMEIALRQEYSAKIDQLIAERDEADARLAAERAAVADERQKTLIAMEQTKALRQQTKREREELEEIKGNLSSFKRRYIHKVADVQFYQSELKDSIAREKRLLAALKLSEDDLARCKAKHRK